MLAAANLFRPAMSQNPSKPDSDAAALNDPRLNLRPITIDDYAALVEVTQAAYKGIGGQPWTLAQIRTLLAKFPAGQLCLLVAGRPVGFALTLIVDYAALGDQHSHRDAIGEYASPTHDQDGDVLYGIDVMLHDNARGMRVTQRLYEARKALCENLNLRAIIAGGRIPGYCQHAAEMSAREYVAAVARPDLYDPVLSFQLGNSFHVRRVLDNYLSFDSESKTWANLIEWPNLAYDPSNQPHRRRRRLVRLGSMQFQVRSLADFADLAALAEPSTPLRAGFFELAVRHNVNVIGGSMPLLEDGLLYDVAWVLRPDGRISGQHKLHVTPSERRRWGVVSGDRLQAISADCGRIGVLICYDVEFLELSRRLVDSGVQRLFVPFLTEMESGYQRVRHCSPARVIENEFLVAISVAGGSLAPIKASDVTFAQPGVYTPSEYPFPSNCTISGAASGSEALLVAEDNLELLDHLKSRGTVRNLCDRRSDLYGIAWRGRRVPRVLDRQSAA